MHTKVSYGASDASALQMRLDIKLLQFYVFVDFEHHIKVDPMTRSQIKFSKDYRKVSRSLFG